MSEKEDASVTLILSQILILVQYLINLFDYIGTNLHRSITLPAVFLCLYVCICCGRNATEI